MAIGRRWHEASHLLAGCHDIIAERPGAEPPGWVRRRGWYDFLAGLPDDALERCERDGLAAHAAGLGAPPDLTALATRAAAACALPSLAPTDVAPTDVGPAAPTHRVGARKRRQLAGFAAALLARSLPARRIVDVGAGHGHLTRHLAEALRVEAIGLERDPARVATARALAGPSARFEAVDLFAAEPDFGPDDLIVGLHACGALTDRLVAHAAASGAAAAFASCCLQKRPEAARAPLNGDGPLGGAALPRPILGLGNTSLGPQGVEATQRENLAARARRAGLRALLRGRGLAVEPGDEMHGINRRRAHDAFDDFVAFALLRRGLPPATAAELRAAESRGRAESDRLRRWSIARRWLGRLIEVQINCDRALYLQRAGHQVELGTLWPAEVSPRNVGVIARRITSP